MNHPFRIGLAFSGGGYRAASFNLGVLTYLDLIRPGGGQSLLQSVLALSTVSGGTITGTRYAIGCKRGESLQTIYAAIYTFMAGTDLIGLSLDRLASSKGWEEGRVKSLANAVADVYHKEFFGEEKLGLLLDESIPIHLQHLSFNATEFVHALPFRFQVSEKLLQPAEREPERGIIGNNYFNVPPEEAAGVRMADILAASSCFPGGFEPINFPTDFGVRAEGSGYPVGLMDGGIVDNQGAGALLLAETRIKKNMVAQGDKGGEHALDLLIISDVASPYMEGYRASEQKRARGWRALTPAVIFTVNIILLLLSGYFIYRGILGDNFAIAIPATIIFTLCLALFIIGRVLTSLPRKFGVPVAFLEPLGKLLRLKLLVYENLIMNRVNSAKELIGEVFLKHIRRLNYTTVFSDPTWENRRIMNAIYELRDKEEGIKKKVAAGMLPAHLIPSSKLSAVASKAAAMGTTLWYTGDQMIKDPTTGMNLLDTVIACGQFTLCWNLLEYVGNLKKNSENTNEGHALLLGCEKQLTEEWKKFNTDPYWLVKEYGDPSKTKTEKFV